MSENHSSADPKEQLKLAKEKYQAGCFQEALAICKPLAGGDSGCFRAVTLVGMCATKLGDYTSAKLYLRRAIEANSGSILAWKALEQYYETFYLYDDMYVETLKFLIHSATDGQESARVKKLFEALVKLRRVTEAINEVERFMVNGGEADVGIAEHVIATLLTKVPCQYEAAMFAKKCYGILRQKGDVDLDTKEKYVKYIMESFLTSDAEEVLAEIHKSAPNNEQICLLYVRLLVERYLDGYAFVETEDTDLAGFLNELLERINVDADADPDSFLWFHLGSALKEMEDLNFDLALARLTQHFDNFVPQQQPADGQATYSYAFRENNSNGSRRRRRPSSNAMFCCGLLLLELKVKVSDHGSARHLVKRSKLTAFIYLNGQVDFAGWKACVPSARFGTRKAATEYREDRGSTNDCTRSSYFSIAASETALHNGRVCFHWKSLRRQNSSSGFTSLSTRAFGPTLSRFHWLVKVNSVKNYNSRPARLYAFELLHAEIEAEISGNEDSYVELFEKVRSETALPQSLRFRAAKRLAITLANQKRLDEALGVLKTFEQDVSLFCVMAECHLICGDCKRAEDLSREAMSLDSGAAEAPYLLSRAIYAQSGPSPATLKLLVTAARLDPYNGDVFFWLGKTLEASKKEKKALECYERSYKLKPYAENIAKALSDFYWRMGMHAKNISLLEAVSRLHLVENRSWAWFQLALQSLLHGSPVDAMQAFQCILRTDPMNPDVMDLLADAYMQSGNLKSAMKSWRKCLTVDTPAIGTYFQLGNALLKGHSHEEARKYFEKTLEIDGNFWPSLVGLASSLLAQGQIMAERGRWPKAFECWRLATVPLLQSVKVNPNSCISWKCLGDCFNQAGRICDRDNVPSSCAPPFFAEWKESTFSCACFAFVASLLYYKAALSLPSASGAWRCLALCLGRLARILPCKILEKLSLKVIRAALRICQLSVKNWTSYGVLASWSGRPRLAQHCFINAIQLRINEGRAWANWGILCLRQRHVEQAYKALAQTQHTQPLSFYGWFGMAFVSIQAAPWDTQDLFRHCTTLKRHPVAANRYCYFFVKNYLKEAQEKRTLSCNARQFIKYALDITSELCDFRTVDPSTHNSYGLLLEIDGNYFSAFQAYTRSLDHMKFTDEKFREVVLTNMLRVCGKSDYLALEHGEKLLQNHVSRNWKETALRALVMARLKRDLEAKSTLLNIRINHSNPDGASQLGERIHLCSSLLATHEAVEHSDVMEATAHRDFSPSRLIVMLYASLKNGLPTTRIMQLIMDALPRFSDSQKRLFFKIVTLYAKSFSIKEKQYLVETFPQVPEINLLWLDCLEEFGVLDDARIDDTCKYKDCNSSWGSIPWFAWFALEKTFTLRLPGTVKWISELYRLMPELNPPL